MSDKENNEKAFDGIFAQQLKEHVVLPPADMWEKIHKNTDGKKGVRALFWTLFNDGAFMILILLVSMMNFASFGVESNVEASNKNRITLSNEKSENSVGKTQVGLNESSVATVLSSEVDVPVNNAKSETYNLLSDSEKRLKTEVSTVRKKKQNGKKFDSDKAAFITHNSDNNSGLTSDKRTDDFGTVLNDSKNAKINEEAPFNNLTEDEIEKLVEAALKEHDSNSVMDESGREDVSVENDRDTEDEMIETEPASSNNETAQAIESEAAESEAIDSIAEQVKAETITEQEAVKEEAKTVTAQQGEMVNEQEEGDEEETAAIDLADTTGIAIADSANVLKSKDLVGRKNHEIFAGVHANFNLPIIFNQNTYEVFNGKELAYTPTFGLASGVRLGYTYKKQYGFETGFIFYSKQGQEYEGTFSGVTARRQVKLQYFNIPLVLRYKFKEKKNKKMPSPWVINLGAQIDLLQSAVITYSGNEFPLDSIQNPQANDKAYFRATNISAVFGVEREVYFTKFLFLGMGIRTTFSSDINAKNRPVMNDGSGYAKSHNFTFGFTLSLNFSGQL